MSLTNTAQENLKKKGEKADLIKQLQAKNESDRQACLKKVQTALAEFNCDVDIACNISGAGTRLVWGIKNK